MGESRFCGASPDRPGDLSAPANWDAGARPGTGDEVVEEDYLESFARVAREDPVVSRTVGAMEDGMPEGEALRRCIVMLSEHNAALLQHVADALAITPTRHRLPGGRIVRWDAPDDAVPIVNQ